MVFKRPLSISPSPSKINENTCLTNLNFCKVCGDKARVNNYGALSCHSCRTFFRRNGFHPKLVYPCQYDGECQVSVVTRKVCTACRLAKCFSVGMSTDLIRKEDYHTKKYSVSTVSDIIQTIMPVSQLPTLDLVRHDRSSLTNSQWTLLSNILHAYDTFNLIPTLHHIVQNLSSSSSSQVCFEPKDAFETIGSMYTAIQSFVSSIPDFQVFSINEQQSLLQRNLHGIASFYSNLVFRETGLFENSKSFQSYKTAYGSETIQQSNCLIKRLSLDTTLCKLMLIPIAFSSNSFIVDIHENMHNDNLIFATFRLYGSQNVYVELLWRYMLYRYGYRDSVLQFSKLVKYILDMIDLTATVYKSHKIHHDFVVDIVEKTKEKLVISQNEPISLWGNELS